MRRVADILKHEPAGRLGVVLSACRGVTDDLLNLVSLAERQEPFSPQLDRIRARHHQIASELCSSDEAKAYGEEIDRDCRDIETILRAIQLIRSAATAVRDLIVGFGEIWSTKLFTRYFAERHDRPGEVLWVDAREVIEVEWSALGPSVRWQESRVKAARWRTYEPDVTLIITGFIARKPDGLQTTLGRNGSDFSASIFGDLLDADEIVIWTDVDGVLSADPRRVPDAAVIDSLSYTEAMELAYFGAKVIHPQTMTPAVIKSIPIWIRNTFAPDKPGSVISCKSGTAYPVKGITSIEQIALVNVEGTGMIGVPGTAQRLFGALREQGISVILISQGGSEHSICFAISEKDVQRTERAVRGAFDSELRAGQIQSIDVVRESCILSIVGDGMAGTPGIASKVFGSLAGAGVNIRAIAQGSSERNISVVIDQKLTTKALRSVHSAFYLSPHTISIGVIGPGAVGRTFLAQLASQVERLAADFHLDLRLRGIATSRRMALSDVAIPLSRWPDELERGVPTDLATFGTHIHADHLPHAVIIDCSASPEVAGFYPQWLAAGIHVVTPNKKASSGPMTLYKAIREARRAGGAHYLYEATVGAGLPIIQTVRDLRETGDDIRRIEGILSGTLAYLFNVWDGSKRFSNIIREAKANGYTEPDPRDDLGGMDVARKLIILGREMGLPIEIEDVELESLIPAKLASCSQEEFMERLPELDDAMLVRLENARKKGHVLRYVGSLDAASKRAVVVGLVEMELSHPFANINLTDNIVRFVTSRYDKNPLVVQGPGAGPAVTAGGVFADLLRVCAYLGAKL